MSTMGVAIFSWVTGCWLFGGSTFFLLRLRTDSEYYEQKQALLGFYLNRICGVILLCIPVFAFILHYIFMVEITLITGNIYLMMMGVLCLVLCGKGMFDVKNLKSYNLPENFAHSVSSKIKFLVTTSIVPGILFLYEGGFLLFMRLFPSVNQYALGVIIFLLDIGSITMCFVVLFFYTMRKGKTG